MVKKEPGLGAKMNRSILLAVALVGVLAVSGCYEIVPSSQGVAYRLNRITGSVSMCALKFCVPVPEEDLPRSK